MSNSYYIETFVKRHCSDMSASQMIQCLLESEIKEGYDFIRLEVYRVLETLK